MSIRNGVLARKTADVSIFAVIYMACALGLGLQSWN
jgi:hypothetical protein